MFKNLVGPLAMFALLICSAQTNAGLIQVRFDDFANNAVASTTVVNSSGFEIKRTISTTGGGFSAFGGVGVFLLGTVDLNYTITGGTFQDFFNTFKTTSMSPKGTLNPGTGSFDGFGFDINVFLPGLTATTVRASYDNFATTAATQTITSTGFYSMTPLPNASNISFRLEAGALAIVTLNSVSAVPEPTGLILVGSVMLGLCSVRRKW